MSDQDFPSPPPEGLPPVPPPPSAGGPPPPPSGGGYASSGAAGLPWEERQSRGFVGGWVETAKLLVTAPQEAFGRMKEKGDYVSPILWVAIIGLVVGILQYIVGLAFGGGNPFAALPADLQAKLGPLAGMASGGVGIGTVIMAPIMAIIGMFIWSGIMHLCLMVVSALGGSNAGYEGSFRAASYAYIGTLPSVVPVIGSLVSLVWTVFLLVVGLSTVHRTTQTKALIAILIPIVLCCVCVIAGGAAIVAGLAGAAANAQ